MESGVEVTACSWSAMNHRRLEKGLKNRMSKVSPVVSKATPPARIASAGGGPFLANVSKSSRIPRCIMASPKVTNPNPSPVTIPMINLTHISKKTRITHNKDHLHIRSTQRAPDDFIRVELFVRGKSCCSVGCPRPNSTANALRTAHATDYLNKTRGQARMALS